MHRSKPNIQINDEIKNKAEIYFDFNFPIVMNESISVISTLNTDRNNSSNSALTIIPTHIYNYFTISGAKQITGVEIFNSSGQLILSQKSTSSLVNTQALLPGIYLVRVIVDGGYVVRRVVKG